MAGIAGDTYAELLRRRLEVRLLEVAESAPPGAAHGAIAEWLDDLGLPPPTVP